ncbi:NlpC/P60 family protein, partial [Xylanimonas oleitrophica]
AQATACCPWAPPAPPTSGVGRGSAAQGQQAVAWARTQIGSPYQLGGTGPAYDCSGLTLRAWQSAGLDISRTSRSQYLTVAKIPYDQMRPGDLIFYTNRAGDHTQIRHVAIYSGGGMMIEAPRPGVAVRETAIRWGETMPYAGRP